MTTAQIKLPPKLIPVFSEKRRIRGAFGGRGSGKTFSFAKMTAIRAYMAAESGQKGVILCAREWMNSLRDSSMAEVKDAINSEPWLRNYFDIGQEYIRTRNGRVEYIFTGLNRNLDSLKSKAKILIAWVDEAEGVTETAWDKLEPTVRAEGSEIWVTWNPELDGSSTDKRFRKQMAELEGNPLIVEVNYDDNPWFPEPLEALRKRQQRTLDPNKYAWIWEGAYLENSDAQVGDRLFISHEAGKVGLELDDTAQFITRYIPEFSNHVVRADSARPESISFLKRQGIPNITGVKKGKGSVEDGIQFVRSFAEIVIHPRCKETIREFRLYSYKVDKRTGDILPVLVDKDNHYVDALRYAIEPMIKPSGFILDVG